MNEFHYCEETKKSDCGRKDCSEFLSTFPVSKSSIVYEKEDL